MISQDNVKALKVTIYEDQGFYYMARVEGEDGEAVTQSSVSSIVVKCYDRNDSDTLVYDSILVVVNTIFNTLQTPTLDPRWQVDRIGYNFGGQIPAAAFPLGSKSYWLEIIMTPISGDIILLTADVSTLERFSG